MKRWGVVAGGLVLAMLFGLLAGVKAEDTTQVYLPLVRADVPHVVFVAGREWPLVRSVTATQIETSCGSIVWRVIDPELESALSSAEILMYDRAWFGKTYQGIGKGIKKGEAAFILYGESWSYWSPLTAMEEGR